MTWLLMLLTSVVMMLVTPHITNALILEAEDAHFSDRFEVSTNHPGFTGSGFVDAFQEGFIEWTLQAETDGVYELAFRYALGGPDPDRPLNIEVDGSELQHGFSFPSTGSWDVWEKVSLSVTLSAGQHVVRAITTGLSAANFDHLDVSLQEVSPRDYHYLNAVSQGAFAPKYDLTPRDEPEFDPANLNNGYRDTYYGKVDPEGLRTTLEDWRAHHRFDDFPLSTSHATFINAGDLDPGQTGGLGRDMFCLNDGRAFPCYVQNYLDPKGVKGDPDQIGRDMVATVAMERMLLTEGVHDREIVAFFVFDKDGKRVNRIALDSEGDKAVPEQCYGCHMGQTDPFDTDGSGNFTVGLGVPAGGQYLPFDINSFENWPGQPTLADQAHEFRRLNEHVRSAAQNRKESIQNLILGWYGREPGDFVHFDDTYDGSFIPDEWFTDPQGFEVPGSPAFDLYFQERSLYANVYQHYCRTCHVAQGAAQNGYPTRGVNWEKASAFCVEAQRVACSDTFTPRMPHAEHTFNRFVNDVLNFTDGTSATPQQVLCDTICVVGPTGEEMYTTYCSSCHEDLANSTKKGRTAAQITDAIRLEPAMKFLNTLTQDQIEAIADALQ